MFKVFLLLSTSGSGGDVILRYFLPIAQVAFLFSASKTICAIMIVGIMLDISEK